MNSLTTQTQWTTFLGRMALCGLACGVFVPTASGQAANACDLNSSGSVTSADVDLATNMAIGGVPCTANIIGTSVCNVAVVQRVINAVSGNCVTGVVRPVVLNWTASVTPGVSYKVYRSTTPGGSNPTLLTASPVTGTTFTDESANVGNTYYYTVRAVSGSTESIASNEAQAAVTPAS